MAAVNTHGLFNLSDFLPKKPDATAVKVMQEMFEASVDGEAYDPDRWSHYFRPSGMQARTGDPTKQQAQMQLQLAKVLRSSRSSTF